MLNCFNSSRVGPELVPYIKMAKMGTHFENEQFRLCLLLFSCCLPSRWRLKLTFAFQVSHLHLLQTLLLPLFNTLNSSPSLKTLRYSMKLESKTFNSADAVIERVDRRGITADRSKCPAPSPPGKPQAYSALMPPVRKVCLVNKF